MNEKLKLIRIYFQVLLKIKENKYKLWMKLTSALLLQHQQSNFYFFKNKNKKYKVKCNISIILMSAATTTNKL